MSVYAGRQRDVQRWSEAGSPELDLLVRGEVVQPGGWKGAKERELPELSRGSRASNPWGNSS